MAVDIPSIIEIEEQIINDIATEFDVQSDQLGDTVLVNAKVDAAQLYQFYLALSKIENNIFPDLCDEDILIRYGSVLLGRKPAPAEAGEYTVEITGTIGATINSGTTFRADDTTTASGYLFVVDSSYTLIAEVDTITIRSLNPGLESLLVINDTLTSTSPILNIDNSITVTAISKTPIAAEDIENYRADVLLQYRLEPQGGSPSDYRLWALDVPEVRNTYPYLDETTLGNVIIYIEATEANTEPGQIIGVPSQSTMDEVYQKPSIGVSESGVIVTNPVTGRGRRPIGTKNITTLPVNPISVDLDFTELTDETISIQIKTAIENYLYDVRPFVAGAEIQANKNDILTIGQLIAVVISVIAGTGITYTSLTMNVDNTTVGTYTFLLGNYPFLRNVTNNGTPI